MTTNLSIFLEKLLANPSQDTVLRVFGKERKIRGMARFTSKNLHPDEYIKIAFIDHSHMIISIPDETIFFAEKTLGELKSVSDKEIGNINSINYQDKQYTLDNKHDYQYCLAAYVGKPGHDIEGEVSFSDYVFKDNNKIEMISLGILSDNGKRADVFAYLVSLDDIEIL